MKDDERLRFLRLLELVSWSLELDEDSYVVLDKPNLEKAPKWDDYVTEGAISSARKVFEENGRVAVKASIKVSLKDEKSVQLGTFKIFIERDENLKKGESHYLRNGIRLIEIKGHSTPGIRGMVVIDDSVLSEMLGNAENPAHTDWQRDAANFAKYIHGSSSLSFIKSSLSFWVGKLTEITGSIERDLLRDMFFVERPNSDGRHQKLRKEKAGIIPANESDIPQIPDLPERSHPINARQTDQDIVIEAGENGDLAGEVTVRFAYDVRSGNPFQRYSPLDFDLDDETSIQIKHAGVKILERSRNSLKFIITEPKFRIRVRGFDELRDVVMDIKWIEREAELA